MTTAERIERIAILTQSVQFADEGSRTEILVVLHKLRKSVRGLEASLDELQTYLDTCREVEP